MVSNMRSVLRRLPIVYNLFKVLTIIGTNQLVPAWVIL
jgi:hypothetical protein